jgi:hypothetical protein
MLFSLYRVIVSTAAATGCLGGGRLICDKAAVFRCVVKGTFSMKNFVTDFVLYARRFSDFIRMTCVPKLWRLKYIFSWSNHAKLVICQLISLLFNYEVHIRGLWWISEMFSGYFDYKSNRVRVVMKSVYSLHVRLSAWIIVPPTGRIAVKLDIKNF